MMGEPTGWKWIEAWNNGTISEADFASLQKLLREQPDARRTLRRYMAMDTALHDRAEARLLTAVPEAIDDTSLVRPIAAPRFRISWREVVAWSTAAACLLVAMGVWFTMPTSNQNESQIVESPSPADNPVAEEPQLRTVALTIADQREQLLASAPDVLHLQLVSDSGVASASSGDIVWSSGRQIGYLRLQGLASNKPAQRQYQLWIVGSDVSGNELISGGVFPVDQNTGELILPIQADQFVQQPKMFVVSVEPSGGGNTMNSLLAKADSARP